MTDTKLMIPVYSCKISPAKDQYGKTIGVEISILFVHNQITELPLELMEAAYRVLDKSLEK